jgi:hypothetical protein
VSTPLAIAAVTAVLTDVLNRSISTADVTDILGNTKVTAKPPDRLVPNGGTDPTGLNLFLYQVSPNQGWHNVGLPTRDTLGRRTDNAPLVLDLHYLLTATGAQDFWAEILLGYAMQGLHEAGVLSRPYIRQVLSTHPNPAMPPQLVNSELPEQVEQIRITQSALTIDDLYKLWSGFQGRYRLTAAYLVTAVLIESARSTRASLPVKSRFVEVMPFDRIVIDKVAADDNKPIMQGATVIVSGSGLAADNVQLMIDGVDRTALATSTSASKIKLALPSPLGNLLRAGTHGLQVVHPLTFGTNVPHRSRVSNLAAFVLHPALTVKLDGSATYTMSNNTKLAAAILDLTLDPAVTKDQKVVAILNATDGSDLAYSFAAPAGNGIVAAATEMTTVKVPVRGVVAGTYLVRATVDGAASLLKMSQDPVPMYNEPTVTL